MRLAPLNYLALGFALALYACSAEPTSSPLPEGACLQDGKTAVAVGEDGTLLALRNLATGTDYAGGAGLWRLYYNTPERKEIEVTAKGQTPAVSVTDGAIRIP